MAQVVKKKSNRGFAKMKKENPKLLSAIAARGGAAVPDERRSFAQDHDLAVAAGRKGGEASHGGGRRRSKTPNSGVKY